MDAETERALHIVKEMAKLQKEERERLEELCEIINNVDKRIMPNRRK